MEEEVAAVLEDWLVSLAAEKEVEEEEAAEEVDGQVAVAVEEVEAEIC